MPTLLTACRDDCNGNFILIKNNLMKIYHNSEIDYLSIDFKDEVESKSEYTDGIIVRYDKKGHVIGIDITDSMKLFSSSDLMTL